MLFALWKLWVVWVVRVPLPKKEKWDVNHGYSDFPRELGFQSVHDYVRSQPY